LVTGVLDPAKVTINAIENAASIAALVLTTEVLITEIPKKEVLVRVGVFGNVLFFVRLCMRLLSHASLHLSVLTLQIPADPNYQPM